MARLSIPQNVKQQAANPLFWLAAILLCIYICMSFLLHARDSCPLLQLGLLFGLAAS
jgi:hypothetical protein